MLILKFNILFNIALIFSVQHIFEDGKYLAAILNFSIFTIPISIENVVLFHMSFALILAVIRHQKLEIPKKLIIIIHLHLLNVNEL